MDVKQTALACLLGGFFLIALVRLFRKPLRLAVRLAVNTALGFAALWLVRATAALTGITLGVNLFNAALIGALGLPGFLLLLLSQWVLG
mgnify:CR=1 FL=1